MFFVSVLLQAFINSLFFIFPVSEFLKYAFQKDSSESTFQFVYILMPYHGTAATIVMICFTKPIREKIISDLKCNRSNKVSSVKNLSKTMN
uniref:Serpentine receptor class gamma n=1 Tax=Caenorhabditis tropicalis TaxID=1561998 RepID=A0A1I7UAX8_9PELO